MENDMIIKLLNKAWDALEGLPVTGYSARARIQTAEECILAVYNELKKIEPGERDPGEEGGDGDD